MPRLDLNKLVCERKQEAVGKDEISVTVNGVEVFNRKMAKGQSERCDHMEEFGEGELVAVTVEERDGSRHKPIGPVQHFSSGEAGSGEQKRDFSTSGAKYVLFYEVTA
ncbi:hypothetical protein ACU610_17655 [Geodermatophilus sp. URMC 61]|uniref:hypothetical protein n=1 Tax=Geodermatophilus sp. URMC 61 TaxID=3423411 RepID=UPI00406C8E7A